MDKVQQAVKYLKEQGYIVELWHTEDIINHAEKWNKNITEEQAKEIAKYVQNNYNKNEGINWQTITSALSINKFI